MYCCHPPSGPGDDLSSPKITPQKSEAIVEAAKVNTPWTKPLGITGPTLAVSRVSRYRRCTSSARGPARKHVQQVSGKEGLRRAIGGRTRSKAGWGIRDVSSRSIRHKPHQLAGITDAHTSVTFPVFQASGWQAGFRDSPYRVPWGGWIRAYSANLGRSTDPYGKKYLSEGRPTKRVGPSGRVSTGSP